MTAQIDLGWLQGNPATLNVVVTDDDTGNPVSLAGLDDIVMYLKAAPETDDSSGTALSSTTGEITITDAAAGRCTITVPADLTTEAGLRWYRVDLLPGPHTAAYGNVRIKDT